jgi:hypothetical protein
LHGLPWGEGDGSLLDWDEKAKWLVLQVPDKDVLIFDGKCKFPKCKIVHVGDRKSAPEYILLHGGVGHATTAATVSAGYLGTATAGDRGTATAGDLGTATAGDRGTATAGDRGTATAGYRGTATAGDLGTATAGYRGTATAGSHGTIILRRWDAKKERYYVVVGNVGEDGIEENKPYHLDDSGKIVPGEHQEAKAAREENEKLRKET